ncbi:MAG TPA: hypothetical protein VGC42_18485 [Kofleriaceae bacterium]
MNEPAPAELLAEAEQVPIPLARPRDRPRPTPRQARRIDRLSRAAHRFHRHAHHPLCDRYAGEVLRVRWRGRRVYLCRGCSFAVIGGLAGGVAGLGLAAVGRGGAAIALGALIAGALLLIPTVVSPRRLPKLVTRLAPAALLALGLTVGFLAHRWLVLALAGAAVIGLRGLYGRRGGDRSPCTDCPERMASPCSGFVQIVRREQAFQRVARRLLG